MRKLLFIMMALLVAPAMAEVTISIVDNGDCTADIVLTTTGADTVDGAGVKTLVAGIAINASVDVGTIDDVTGFMADGVSTAASPGFGIFMGNIEFEVVGEETQISAVGTPVAPATAPDAPGQLGTSAIVLEFGSLFDVAVPGDAADATTTLCTVHVSEAATLTVTLEDITRGGIKNIGGGEPDSIAAIVPVAITCGGTTCWDYPCFPYGDANGDDLISALDVQVLLLAWGQPYELCADFNKDGIVSALDVQVLLLNWGSDCP